MTDLAALLPNAMQQFTDENGNPYAGGSVYFYIPATSTFKNTWKDPGATILNANPVTLDAAGRAIIYGEGDYRQVLFDANGNEIWDQLTSSNQNNSGSTIPSGVILMWSGSIGSIPSGWTICDGTSGTPDLRDKFVIGAGNTYTVDQTGGSATVTIGIGNLPAHTHAVNDPDHTHTVNDPTHSHGVTDPKHYHAVGGVVGSQNGATNTLGGAGSVASGPSTFVTSAQLTNISVNSAATGITNAAAATGITLQNTGSGNPLTTISPYWALAYIMKL